MLPNKWIPWLFILMVVGHLLFIMNTLREVNNIKAKGSAYKFEVRGVDPIDVFRGRYINLPMPPVPYSIQDNCAQYIGDKRDVYATFTTDQHGFARINNISMQPPEHDDFLKMNGYFQKIDSQNCQGYFYYPFDRFYVNEFKAPMAEEVMRQFNMDSTVVTYALVYISKGDFLLDNIYVDDQPIGEILDQYMQDQKE